MSRIEGYKCDICGFEDHRIIGVPTPAGKKWSAPRKVVDGPTLRMVGDCCPKCQEIIDKAQVALVTQLRHRGWKEVGSFPFHTGG